MAGVADERVGKSRRAVRLFINQAPQTLHPAIRRMMRMIAGDFRHECVRSGL
jgi:hypothetical protein